MRSFSTVHDRHNKSLGRASYNKQLTKKNTLKYDQHKMPFIVDFVAGRALMLYYCENIAGYFFENLCYVALFYLKTTFNLVFCTNPLFLYCV